jgi:hypothetical protein
MDQGFRSIAFAGNKSLNRACLTELHGDPNLEGDAAR